MQLSGIAAARIRDARAPVLVENWTEDARCHPLGKAPLVIGSAPDADVLLPDLPARAVFLQRSEDGNFEVFSFESSLGLTVDGVAHEAGPLGNGQILQVGGRSFLFVDPTADVLPGGLQLALWGAPTDLPASPGDRNNEDFHTLFSESLAQVPWLMLSCLLHAGLGLLLWVFSPDPEPPPEIPNLETEFAADEETEEEEWELEPEEPEVEETIESEEVPEPIESEELTESEDEGPPEVGEEEESETALGAASALSGGDMGGGAPGNGMMAGIPGGQLKKSVGRLRESGLDIVFLLDATASMDGEITAAKRRIGEMIALLEALGIRFRIGVVAFRDVGDDYVTIEAPLTSYRYRAVAFLDRVEAAGGGDTPEAVTEALKAGGQMKFSRRAKKIMVLVGDAPPSENSRRRTGEGPSRALIEKFHRRGGVLHTVYADDDDDDTRRLFREFAQIGGGTSIMLHRDEQLIEDVILLALESDDRRSVRRLMQDIESGPRVDLLRKVIARGDSEIIARQLARRPLRPHLALELMRASAAGRGRSILPACFEILGRKDTELPTAWLCTVLMRREVERIARDNGLRRPARRALAAFHPELGRGRRQSLLGTIAKELYDRGFLLSDAVNR